MKFDLAQMAARTRRSRAPIPLPPIVTTKAQADALAKIILRPVRGWQAATPQIIDAYAAELHRTLQTDSPDQLGGMIGGIGEALQRLVLTLTPDLRDWAFSLETWHRGKWARGILSGTGIDITTLIGPEDTRETVETVVQRNVALIRDVTAQAQAKITESVFRGLQQRTPAREVAKEIREATGMARKRAVRIAAHQTVNLASQLDTERQRQAGDKFKYRHSGKLHARPWHRARNGKIYDIDTLKQVDGADQIEANDAPGVPPGCGCLKQGVIVFEDA